MRKHGCGGGFEGRKHGPARQFRVLVVGCWDILHELATLGFRVLGAESGFLVPCARALRVCKRRDFQLGCWCFLLGVDGRLVQAKRRS